MIVVKLIGGLGNQMFQYAAARALSLRKGVEMRLDVSGFENYSLHQGFELSTVFNCQAKIADGTDIRRILGWRSPSRVRNLLAREKLAWLRGNSLAVEPHFEYWPGIDALSDECYLAGYWQSERYFQGEIAQIRKDFEFKTPLSGENRKFADLIQDVNSVSLHVRRGDYVSNPTTTAIHGVCSLEYYQSAIEYMNTRVDNPHFFVFSDDPEWAKENLKFAAKRHYIDFNSGAQSYNDMRLMSICKHHIIANSSFSWWGAWLNPEKEKNVIAPKKWFNKPTDTRDLVPGAWRRF